jgi:ribokinase
MRVTVLGSLNMDLVVKAARLPQPGETVTGGTLAMFPGGKGGNQAVAAARLGACVSMVGRVGADVFGRELLEGLAREGIDAARVQVDPGSATGVALIAVDSAGRNLIVVAPGANARVAPADVEAALALLVGSDALLLQLEVPLDAVVRAASIARAAGVLVCLDPAPALPLPEALYGAIDVIVPNAIEAEELTGVAVRTARDAERAAAVLHARGVAKVVVKRGEQGAFYLSADAAGALPAARVAAVDTTAAGDAFAAALVLRLAEGAGLAAAAAFATRAAGVKVTRMGAQPGMPRRDEVEAAGAG